MDCLMTELAKRFPEINTIPKDVAEGYESQFAELWESLKRCDSCTKNGSDRDCYQMAVAVHNKRPYFGAALCKKQVQFFRMKRAAELLNQYVGQRFQARLFETFEVTEENRKAYERCRQYAETFKPKSESLILVGECGTGKTHLAVAILQRVVQKGIFGVFVTVPELINSIKKNFDSKTKNYEVIDLVKTADFLVLDDLGAEKEEKPGSWVSEQLFIIMNARYEKALPTVITSNFTLDELEKRIGERVTSRMAETFRGVRMGGRDYRKRKLGAS